MVVRSNKKEKQNTNIIKHKFYSSFLVEAAHVCLMNSIRNFKSRMYSLADLEENGLFIGLLKVSWQHEFESQTLNPLPYPTLPYLTNYY
jgi:hypothetical protein